MPEEVDESGAQVFRNQREVTDAGLNLLLKMKLGTWKELRNTARPTAVIIQATSV